MISSDSLNNTHLRYNFFSCPVKTGFNLSFLLHKAESLNLPIFRIEKLVGLPRVLMH